jgi:NAD(P)-dependent dehydrogenase (short-subunit alcohol dehydrogenase family)
MAITLSQRSALVTGSSRGIGRGIALKLAEAGVKRIAVNYVENDRAAEETARLLKDRGAEPLLLKANVGNVDELKAMFSKVKETWDSLDIYVSNARASLATGFYASPMEITLEQWHATIDTQATEFLVACREAVSMMGRNGRILAITYAPGSAKGSWQPWVAMGSAKAAKESLVRYFAVALAPRGITVNAVSPGACDDSVLSGLPPEVFKLIQEWHQSGWTPMRRLGLPADIGNAVVLMCSEQAGFITGQTLHVDGGGSTMMADFPLAIQGVT